MKNLVFAFILICFGGLVQAQNLTQTVTGTIKDLDSKAPLIGVMVQLLQGDSTNATYSDINGRFTLNDVPVGRVNIGFNYTGYEPKILSNLTVVSGKQLQINVELEESVQQISEVNINVNKKQNPNNEQIVVSNIQLNPEQTGKYAGTLQDVSRMAANYAGIVPAGDQRNDIIIRGNSPIGVLWRLEGINIPNPNHFGNLGNTGGPVSILNNNNLAKSDFMTGAFPAQYGNALAGAFDLQMRSGNFNKYEFTGQMGFNGLELGAEGPLSKKKNASFMANYRYSTLGVFDALNINFGVPAVPQYQDFAFKVDIKSSPKIGRFELFGIGGLSYIELLDSKKDPEKWSYTDGGTDVYFGSDMGVAGLKHTIFLNKKTSWKNTIAFSGSRTSTALDTLEENTLEGFKTYEDYTSQLNYSYNTVINSKLNAKWLVNGGATVDLMQLKLDESHYDEDEGKWEELNQFNDYTALIQSYAQARYKWNSFISTNLGVHFQYFTLNNDYIFEPRLGTVIDLTPKQSINIGAGVHAQIQPIVISLAETRLDDGTILQTNKDLPFTRSNHLVVGYNYQFLPNWRFKAEAYYQDLSQIPVFDSSYYSLANVGADFGIPQIDSLQSKGTGENYGLEVTLEKFYSKGYYVLINGSVYDSWYRGGDEKLRRTAFAGNYTFNALGGYEWTLNQSYVLNFNLKFALAGGRRYIPIDLDESIATGEEDLDIAKAYQKRLPDYGRLDLKIGIRQNKKKYTQEWALDIQNVTNEQNIFREVYNAKDEKIEYEYQLGLFPMVTYRIQF